MMVATMTKFDTVTASLRTDTGRVRDHNEDYVGSWEPATPSEGEFGWLYIVADGVGGAEAGDVASQHATERTIEYFVSGEEKDSADRLLQAVRNANDELREMATKRASGRYMATTMCAALVQNHNALFINVGDSRGYHLRDGGMYQVTNDHSLVAQLVAEGAITPEEAERHPRRNVILSSLGPTKNPQIDLFEVDLNDGDRLILCSDGLTRHVSDGEIARVAQNKPVEEATKILVDLANSRGGSDNISVAIMQIGSGELVEEAVPVRPIIISNDPENASQPTNAWGMWSYTAILAIVEAVLILLVYYLLRS